MNSANNSEAKKYQKNKFIKLNNDITNNKNYNLNQTQIQNKNAPSSNIRKNSVNSSNHTQSNEITSTNSRKNQENNIKLKRENKSMFLNQIQLPLNPQVSPRNVNNIQNFIRLNQGKNSVGKNNKKSLANISNQKLSINNYNYLHNNTENNLSEKYNITSNNEEIGKTYKNVRKNSSKKNIHINRKNNEQNKNFEISVDCPEELHFFYINIFQKGNKINFEKKNEG